MKGNIETIAAESQKYAVPLLFVHGLWCTAAVWRRSMGFLAHRGWTCHAVQLPRARGTSWASWQEAVSWAVGWCDAPPVVIGHDAGALLALAQPHSSAAIGMAPLLRESWESRATLRQRWQAWRGGEVRPARGGMASAWFAHGVPSGTVQEVAGALCSLPYLSTVSSTALHPRLILAGRDDRITPRSVAESLATACGAELHEVQAAHALPWEPGWERRAGEIHKWVVRQLGEPLLLLHGEEEE